EGIFETFARGSYIITCMQAAKLPMKHTCCMATQRTMKIIPPHPPLVKGGWGDFQVSKFARWVELIALISLLLTYGWAAYQRNFIWKDDLSLWSDVVKKSPNKARGHNEVGMSYYERQMPDEAIPFFKKSLSLNPGYAIAHNNLGLCFLANGWVDPAIDEFKQAIQADPFHGMYHINLGIAYWEKGLSDLANKEMQLGKELRRRQKKRPFHSYSQTR
ncbi:MAG: tetratricopeptide repeat protein, partial [Nitrospirota bacterium]|nr:tetratricopeptide repeat protein [Nitrospirota bacterium]